MLIDIVPTLRLCSLCFPFCLCNDINDSTTLGNETLILFVRYYVVGDPMFKKIARTLTPHTHSLLYCAIRIHPILVVPSCEGPGSTQASDSNLIFTSFFWTKI